MSEAHAHQPSKQIQRIIAAADQIRTDPITGERAFLPAPLCQVALPRSDTEEREFLRQSGPAWIYVQAGVIDEGKGPVLQPLPSGAMPRVILAHLSTYAVRHRTREIPIGQTPAEFLRIMGMDAQGARYATLRRQMPALAACRMQLGCRGRTINRGFVETFDAWLPERELRQGERSLWPGVLLLCESFYSGLTESAVPLDARAIRALQKSALALDLYAWLAYRLHVIDGRVLLHWHALRQQFGQDYLGKNAGKDFQRSFVPALAKVLAVYPEARVKPVPGGLLLTGSPPPVPPRTR